MLIAVALVALSFAGPPPGRATPTVTETVAYQLDVGCRTIEHSFTRVSGSVVNLWNALCIDETWDFGTVLLVCSIVFLICFTFLARRS